MSASLAVRSLVRFALVVMPAAALAASPGLEPPAGLRETSSGVAQDAPKEAR